MQWNRSNSISLAKGSCALCNGVGIRLVRNSKEAPCNCVFRGVFRACYNRFRQCAQMGDHVGTVSLDFCQGRDGRRSYSRKREEFIADFCLVSRRVLDESEYKLFRFHFLLGANWKLCCRQLHLERGFFFHEVYRIEQKLGRTYANLEPYPLYPLNEYFNTVVHRDAVPSSATGLLKAA
jgi:hypothetical protein